MYFNFSLRKNPATNQMESYFRLVENYCNELGRVCHRTLLSIGFIDYEIATEDNLKLIQAKGYDYVCLCRINH